MNNQKQWNVCVRYAVLPYYSLERIGFYVICVVHIGTEEMMMKANNSGEAVRLPTGAHTPSHAGSTPAPATMVVVAQRAEQLSCWGFESLPATTKDV